MKSEGQIKHKLAQVRFRHLKRELRNGLSKRSENCQYNGVVDLPGHPEVGICLYKAEDPSQWNGGVCDSEMDDRPAKCPFFKSANTKDSLKESFDTFLDTADRARIAERYPDMAALLWVMDLDKPDDALVSDEGEEPASESEPLKEEPSLPVADLISRE
jgi:hypothetical protein